MYKKENLIQALGFQPKENATATFIKKYADGYAIELDTEKNIIEYGGKIKVYDKDFQNITKPEDWVVLECVNRLLERGYKPENIQLEKVYPAGHGFSGRLDICVTREDGSEYLLIECKTYGNEFNKAFSRLKKDGGQLFTYFKFSNKADVLMLYAYKFDAENIVAETKIVKIEDDYRTGDVKDFYNKWTKQIATFGVWENLPYNFKPQKFTKNNLRELSEDESKKLFHGFASILRKHSVSDKPNAFNKIFNLFLAKLYDEAKGQDEELEFHWRENDDAVDFQIRLINLHKGGLLAFLQKEVEGIKDSDFKAATPEELREAKKKILKFNKFFDIKEVDNDHTFEANHRVLKEVVQLLENYQIRYPRKQQHLSDFFERLLTTGLKQEVGQYFTPPPITKFVARSLPIEMLIKQSVSQTVPELPAAIDYAAGSGHFITEILEEYQDHINKIKPEKFGAFAQQDIKAWQVNPYSWAGKYIYGIEKDSRLVKVAKVGCYFYGDGLAQIIHGDGLDSFKTSQTYRGLLKHDNDLSDSTKAKFMLVVSNPPYSVNDCKDDLEYIGSQKDFTLYPFLSDKSKDIESLFVERTKHLLKDGGVAAIVLPSSILNNNGIQTKAREIILQYFDIVAITELGSNTFMATGTNTVILFLRRRNNDVSQKLKNAIDKFFNDFQDVTLNGIERPISKYVNYVWESCNFDDYKSMLQKNPNEKIKQSETYKDYRKNIKAKKESDFWDKLIETEKEKLLYFILAYPQKTVIVKSGDKDAEKRFLGYEFSNRRGNEGMHPVQSGKTVDQCTRLFDENSFDNPEKASTYIYDAFNGKHDRAIDESMKNNVFRSDLVDMMTFERSDFQKNISLAIKKKVRIESKWEVKKLSEVIVTLVSGKRPKGGVSEYQSGIPSLGGEHIGLDGRVSLSNMKFVPVDFFNNANQGILKDLDILICKDGALTGKTSLFYKTDFPYGKGMINEHVFLLRTNNPTSQKYLFNILFSNKGQDLLKLNVTGAAQGGLNRESLLNIQIPLPPLDIQQKIVDEIEVLEAREKEAKEEVERLREGIKELFSDLTNVPTTKLSEFVDLITKGSSPTWQGISYVHDEQVLFITSENVREGFLDLSVKKYLENRFNTIQERSILKQNDILINIVGASIGRAAIYDLNVRANINQAVALVRCKDDVLNPKFLNGFLNSADALKQYDEMKIDVARANLSLQNVSDLKIPNLSLSEQRRIVSEIEKIEVQIARLEKAIAEIPAQKEAVLKKHL